MVRTEEPNVPCRVCQVPVREGASTCKEHSVAATAPRPTAVIAATLPQRSAVVAGAPPAAAVRRPLGLVRAGVVVVIAGAAWWATNHVHQGDRAAAVAGSLLARPILEPA